STCLLYTSVYSPLQTHFSLVGNIKNAAPLKNDRGNKKCCVQMVIVAIHMSSYLSIFVLISQAMRYTSQNLLKSVQSIAKRLITECRFLFTLLVAKTSSPGWLAF
uniref:Uncharacterized protein n=1 Tax=Glossina palpalis gambiensis TaxID=67801 RepID=A0A1B0BX98_9MUSC